MFEFASKRYFGLDISESAIKLVEIKKTHTGFRLSNARLMELDIDPLLDDNEKRNSVIKENLKQLFAEEGINSGVVALSISGQSVFIRPLRIPKVAKTKIEQIIHYEAQLQVPFPIDEVIWNYELFDIYDSPEVEVTVVAVKKDVVEEKLKIISGIGLGVDFVEVDSFSLFNAADFIDGIKNKIILDIGAKITNIIIVEEQKMWTRSILVGGNDLTKAISESLKISFKEAEELKRKEGLIVMTEEDKVSTPHAAAISDTISPVLVELLTDVSRSIGYYKSQFGETKIFREILLTGGGSKLKNIAQFISENIDIPTKVLNLLEKIKGDIDFELTGDLLGRIDVGVGLALRTVTSLTTKINLLPKEMLRAKEFEKRKWHIYGSLLIVIFIFMTLTGFVNWSNRKKGIALSKAQTLLDSYMMRQKEISQLEREIDSLKARLDFANWVTKKRTKTITVFAELMRLLPEKLWLTNIEQDKDILTLKGGAKGTFESIRVFTDALSRSGLFKAVRVESADVVRRKDDIDVTEDIRAFTIKIEMNPLK